MSKEKQAAKRLPTSQRKQVKEVEVGRLVCAAFARASLGCLGKEGERKHE